jgi:hypothetical protein
VGAAVLWWSSIATSPAVGVTDYQIIEDAAITIEFSELKSFDYVNSLVRKLELYFSFASNDFSGPPECYLWVVDNEKPIQLLLHRDWYTKKTPRRWREEYFHLADLDGSPSVSLSGWLDAFDRYGDAISAYFTARTENLSMHLSFLSFAQAVEGLARGCLQVPELTREEEKRLKKALQKAFKDEFPEDFRRQFGSRICGRFRGLGSASLRERLAVLAERYKEPLDVLCPPS